MRQLFICSSTAVLAATGKPQDLTSVAAGTIGIWQNDDDSKWLSAAPAATLHVMVYGIQETVGVDTEIQRYLRIQICTRELEGENVATAAYTAHHGFHPAGDHTGTTTNEQLMAHTAGRRH